ncbi:MAG: signal peptidase I [Planctomycetaceae bacterium]
MLEKTADRPALATTSQQSPSKLVHRVRHVMEAVIFLALAVVMIRAFQVEGYLITTGSMANALNGAHHRVECPHCHFPFAVGISFDESSPDPFHQNPATNQEEFTSCPNCGELQIPLADAITSQGDQILMHKGAFLFRNPRRFEPALFRNPDQPHEVYIKRIIGLPGESVQLKEGDLYIDGKLIVKTLSQQRHVRELVHDDNFVATDPSTHEVLPRWKQQHESTSQWKHSSPNHNWTFQSDTATNNAFDWIQYQHWLARGGRHLTTVSLPRQEEEIGLDLTPLRKIRKIPSVRKQNSLRI